MSILCSKSRIMVQDFMLYYNTLKGGDLASTWIARPEGRVEDVAHLVNNAANL